MTGAIVAVSTVKADPDQVERFLQRNLGGGVDHMLVFLDDANPPVRELLEAHPHATVVRTGPKYWNGTRPRRVSDRLRINMNLANAVLATVPSVEWMVSIDSDEAVSLDRESLHVREERAVVLPVLEAVSRRAWPDDEPTLFKSRPTEDELAALASLGVIPEPELGRYFRGHQEGKPALRPDLRVRVKVHHVEDETGEPIRPRADGSYVLHYESHSLDDFVRRWKDYAPDAAHLRTHRKERKQIGVALHALYHHEALAEEQRTAFIGRLFDRTVADDVETLDALGLLRPPPSRSHQPQPLPTAQVRQLEQLLTALHPADKHVFNDGGTPHQIAAELGAAADRMVADGSGTLVDDVHRALEQFRGGGDRRHQGPG